MHRILPMTSVSERAWMEVDLAALLANAAAVRGRSGALLLPMVKADAYGLGADKVTAALEGLEPWGYGIATIEEGQALRASGIDRPIVLFTPLLPEELPAAHEARLTPSLGSRTAIESWAMYGSPYHLAIDTGMSRAGIQWRDVGSIFDALERYPPEGAYTHFHSAALHDGSIAMQEQRFRDAVSQLPERPRILHTEASAAIERHGPSEWTVTRPGIFLYGVSSGEGAMIDAEPVVHVRARIVETRVLEAGDTVSYDATYTAETTRLIATIPMGYADGYPRSLSNVGSGIVRGRRVPIAGRVTMDMIMLDVTDTGCEVGDVVTMIGTEPDGDTELGVSDVSALAGMSYYELLTGLRGRLHRIYTN
ncbi:MAG TPA: alanine racemase [Gemmatimonadaceae bacterium]|nr:alanine racemase [Gemmatimonadaceae bacterium]